MMKKKKKLAVTSRVEKDRNLLAQNTPGMNSEYRFRKLMRLLVEI